MQIMPPAQHPDLIEVLEHPELTPGPHPRSHDTLAERLWSRPAEEFGDHQLAPVRADDVITHANSIPLTWHDSPPALPQGSYGWALEQPLAHKAATRT